MQPLSQSDAIIDFCLAPLNLAAGTDAEAEVRRRLTHVLKTYQLKIGRPEPVDFTRMPTLVINEAAHGYE